MTRKSGNSLVRLWKGGGDLFSIERERESTNLDTCHHTHFTYSVSFGVVVLIPGGGSTGACLDIDNHPDRAVAGWIAPIFGHRSQGELFVLERQQKKITKVS